MKQFLKNLCILAIFSLLACKSDTHKPIALTAPASGKVAVATSKEFNDYWYSGKAELNSYTLKQSRYGEIREGEVVLVFVTEPFSLSKQVKLDNEQAAGEDNVPVMKLNQIRKFVTGIYDYSIMSSTFTPVDTATYPNTLKINSSIQEWCGHTFTQLNLQGDNYQFQEFSYFESEGDTERSIPIALLEEELMTRIRLQKGELQIGEIDLIFSTLYSRLAHQELKVAKANISKNQADDIVTYSIAYLNYDRTVTIDVQNEFPYSILSWTEDNGDGLITEATLKKSINEPYWNQKSLADEEMRTKLGLQK
jgi:hypothetical protein